MLINPLFTLIHEIIIKSFDVWLLLNHLFGFSQLAFDEFSANFVLDPVYDYIVVGAGSAGSTVALRLAEKSGGTVLLIEAGQEASSLTFNIPALAPLLQQSYYDWNYQTVRQYGACLGLKDQRSNWPMGRVVGGTSVFNTLIYSRGHHRDYASWSADNPTWGYDQEARFFFRVSEKQTGQYVNDSVHHGTRGLWPVSDLRFSTPLSSAVLSAAKRLGHEVGDLNAGARSGFMRPQVNAKDGARHSVTEQIKMAVKDNPRLTLLTKAVVEKVMLTSDNEAVGVQYHRFNARRQVRCRRSVILSAGVIGTPKILMLSGIGPRQHLTDLRIRVRQDLPVGKNLQDHVTTGLDLVLLNTSLSFSLFNFLHPVSVFDYYWSGTGPWTFPGCGAIGMVHTRFSDPAVDAPDLQLMAMPAGISADGGAQFRTSMGIRDEIWSEYFAPLVGRQTASILPVVLHPRSRGFVQLRSTDYMDPPVINPRYLTAPRDVAVMYEGIKLIKALIATEEMQSLGAELYNKPFPGCQGHRFDSVAYWECYIRHLTLTAYHPVGTCRMGPKHDPTAVVDRFLRVHGTDNLLVMDASVLPALPSGNPNAVVVMAAEKGVAMLLRRHIVDSSQCHAIDVFLIKTTCSDSSPGARF